jgi:hypothetical protein
MRIGASRAACAFSAAHDLKAVRAGQQQDCVAAPTCNNIEVIENIPAQDTQIGSGGISECSELPADAGYVTILAKQFERGAHYHVRTGPPIPLRAISGERWLHGNWSLIWNAALKTVRSAAVSTRKRSLRSEPSALHALMRAIGRFTPSSQRNHSPTMTINAGRSFQGDILHESTIIFGMIG